MLGCIIGTVVGAVFFSAINEAIDMERERENERKHQIEMLELRYENERKDDEEALSLFNQRKDDLISKFTTKLTEEFTQNFDFCKKEMEEEYNNFNLELNNIIDKITSIENNENLFGSRIEDSIEKLSTRMAQLEVKHLNILLVGPSGVGKSFLINTVLKLKEGNLAKNKLSKPTTKAFKVYESSTIPNIRLIDSRGIEKGDYNVDEVVKEITSYVESRELAGNPDDYIHCIWYCITGTRFEDIEEETLSKLSAIYDNSKLPVIVVYTQAMVPDYYNAIKEDVIKVRNDIEFIPVVAQDIKLFDGSYVKSKNIDLLMTVSLEKAKNAVSSSVFSSLRKIVKNDTDTQIENSLNKIKEKLSIYTTIDGNPESVLDFNEEKNYNEAFKNLLYGDDSKKDLKEDTKKAIIELINKLNKKNNEIMNSCLNDFIKKTADELGNQLLELQNKVNQERGGHLKQYKSRNTFSEEVRSLLYDSISLIAKNFGHVNYIKLLPLKLAGLLSNYVKNQLFSFINANSPENIINRKIQGQFKNILSFFKNKLF